jgi:hypothetical protein
MNKLINLLKDRGIKFDLGLTNEELKAAENKYHFRFPPDLREFLSTALPIDSNLKSKRSFPNWRNLDDPYIKKMLSWPVDGLKFDVENNDFWLKSLGNKPKNKTEQLERLTKAFLKAPKLIPIFSHRFIPAEPCESGNPILSFYQPGDVIYYGADLEDYFLTEFNKQKWMSSNKKLKRIQFWDEVLGYAG